ncbi:MAG: NTP transferase domain-containing protein, partial [Solirubrobacterales bacterium]|nr:NTP transferase domain-containing protein [Solirubrobacterales bacterium]
MALHPSAPNSRSRSAALLLTGGTSKRMGRTKALIKLHNMTLSERTAGLLLRVAAPVLEVGPGHTELPV